jgi:hypothetical protein
VEKTELTANLFESIGFCASKKFDCFQRKKKIPPKRFFAFGKNQDGFVSFNLNLYIYSA